MQRNDPSPTFFTLPAEIRTLIYRNLLVRSAPLPPWRSQRSYGLFDLTFADRWAHLVSVTPLPTTEFQSTLVQFGQQRPRPEQLLHPAILCVSKSVYEEALPLLYAENTFVVDARGTATEWRDHLPERHLHMVRSLHVSIFWAAHSDMGELFAESFKKSGYRFSKEIQELCPQAQRIVVEVVTVESLSGVYFGTEEDGEEGEEAATPVGIEDSWARVMVPSWLRYRWEEYSVRGDMRVAIARELEQDAKLSYSQPRTVMETSWERNTTY